MLEIGAMTSLSALVRRSVVREGWPLLAQAASRVATPPIRSSATLGGNLCYAEAASDPAPALLCLEAQVRVADSVGERVVPIGEFFTGFYETAVAQGEILTAVRVPPMPPGARAGYVKFCPRSAEDKPLIAVAAPTPIRARRAEAALSGAALTEPAIHAAADAAAAEADPLSDLMGSADY